MTKAELLTKVEAKVGYHSLIQDELAPDNIAGDPIEKRFLYVNHTNADGTMGKKFVYYLHDTVNDVASFYNVEENLDSKELPTEVQAIKALENYLLSNFEAYFILRYDLDQRIAEADVFELVAGQLETKKVLVFKKGSQPINHLNIV